MNRLETLELLWAHQSDSETVRAFLTQTIDFVTQHERFWQRENLVGHLTGSAWVVSADRNSVLLLHHAKLDRWLQPGGHADASDENLAQTARREAVEECGLADLDLLSAAIFDLDVHPIPARGPEPAHLHFDVRFIFQVPDNTKFQRNPLETKDIAWVLLDTLCAETTPESLRRMALKTRNFQ